MPNKVTPSIVCLWHATHRSQIGNCQRRKYGKHRYPHTCRTLKCKVYNQRKRTCTPGNPHRCDKCPWTDFPEPPPNGEPFPPDPPAPEPNPNPT